MERQQVSSSDLASIGYDPSTHILEVEFVTGSLYQYQSVPSHTYRELMSASSHGRYFNQFIKKGTYTCVRIR